METDIQSDDAEQNIDCLTGGVTKNMLTNEEVEDYVAYYNRYYLNEDPFDDNISMDGPSDEAPDESEYYEEEYARMLQSEAEMVRISGSGTASPTVGDSGRATPDTDRSFTSLSSSKRQYLKKYRAAKTISAVVKSHLELLPKSLTADNTKIICMALKQMGIYDDVKNEMNSNKTTLDSNVNEARLSIELRKKVWDFYHKEATCSTNTSRPAVLKVDARPPAQSHLEFHDKTVIVSKRNKSYWQSPWLIHEKTLRQLFSEFLSENQLSKLSWGSFLKLKPFYVREPSPKDVEMCVCKTHLNGRNGFSALKRLLSGFLNVRELQHWIGLGYEEILMEVMGSCYLGLDHDTYLAWSCTPDKHTMCKEMCSRWSGLCDIVTKNIPADVTVHLVHFRREGSRDVSVKENMDVKRLLAFIYNLLGNLIHHRNLLKHFRSCYPLMKDSLSSRSFFISADFSENLLIPLYKEPQSLHWSKKMVSIHCSVVKEGDKKSYYGHISDDVIHDQSFVISVMISTIQAEIKSFADTILIQSDNCASQYKSAESFYDLQNLSNNFGRRVIRVYGVAGHGKSEVDSVGGTLKIAVRRAVSCGSYFEKSSDIVSFLSSKFGGTKFNLEEVETVDLNRARLESNMQRYETVRGSSKFQAIVFKPAMETFKACNFLCFCVQCSFEYGSCANFKEFKVKVSPSLASDIIVPSVLLELDTAEVETVTNLSDTICFAKDLTGNVYLTYVIKEETHKEREILTDFKGNVVSPGETYWRSCPVEMVEESESEKYHFDSHPRKKLCLSRDHIIYSMIQHEKSVKKQKHSFKIDKKYLDDIFDFINEFESACL